MKLLLVLAIFFILFASPSKATLGIGVMPSKTEVVLSDETPRVYIPLKIWNEGTDAGVYKIIPDSNILPFMSTTCMEPGYWCEGQTFVIEGKTDRFTNYTRVDILFKRKISGEREVDSGFYIVGELLNKTGGGMVGIEPRLFVKVKVKQTGNADYPDEYSQTEHSDGMSGFATTTTTETESQTITTTHDTLYKQQQEETTKDSEATGSGVEIVNKNVDEKSVNFNWIILIIIGACILTGVWLWQRYWI